MWGLSVCGLHITVAVRVRISVRIRVMIRIVRLYDIIIQLCMPV